MAAMLALMIAGSVLLLPSSPIKTTKADDIEPPVTTEAPATSAVPETTTAPETEVPTESQDPTTSEPTTAEPTTASDTEEPTTAEVPAMEEPTTTAEPTTAAPSTTAGIMAADAPLTQDDGFTSDLSDILTGVTVTDLLNQDVPEFVVGSDYKFTLTFNENNDFQLQYNGDGVLFYQLPPEITVIDPVIDQPILAGITPIGIYSINTNGYVTVKFDDVKEVPTGSGNWVQTPGTNFIDNYINAFFNLEIKAQFSQYGDDVKIDFSDNYTYTVTILEKPTISALAITKTVTPTVVKSDGSVSLDPTVNHDWKLHYTSVITATAGTVTDITYRDDATFWPKDGQTGFIYPTDTSFLEDVEVSINGGGYITYTLADGPGMPGTYYWVDANDGKGGFYLTFPDGTMLSQGQNITVKYTIDFPKLYIAKGSSNNPYQTAWYGTLDALTNNAYTSGHDGADQPLDEIKATAVVSVIRTYFDKTGVLSPDGNTLTWTATVGDGIELLSGKTVYDKLDPRTGDPDTQNFNNTVVTVQMYAADKTTIVGTDSFTAGQGTSSKQFTYVVNTPGSYYAAFTYSIPISNKSVAGYRNEIGITVNGNNYGTDGYVSNPTAQMNIQKTGAVTPDGNYIQWTITWAIPASYYQKSAWLRDYFVYGGQGFQNFPTDVTVTADEGSGPRTLNPNDSVYGWGTQMSSDDIYWFFVFAPSGVMPVINQYGNVTPDVGSLSPFENGSIITITYKSSLDDLKCIAPTSSTSAKAGDTLRTALENPNAAYQICNQIWWYGHITQDSSGYNFTGVSSPILKKAALGGGGQYVDYTVLLDNVGGNSNYQHYDMGDDPVFTDTFNSDLMEYVTNSFYVYSAGYNHSSNGVDYNDAEWSSRYFGAYDPVTKQDLLKNYITDNHDGTSTISIHLKDLMRIVGPTGYYANKNIPAWIGTPTSVYSFPKNGAGSPEWWLAANRQATQPIYIFYRLELKSDNASGAHDVYNKATINTVWSADNTSTIGKDLVTKDMQLTSAGNIMSVTVDVNPFGKTLAPESSNGLYEVEDQMSDGLAAFLNSVTIQAETSPGSGVWETQDIDPVYGNKWSFKTTTDNQIFFTVPDATSFRITYNTLVKGAVGDNVDVTNTVSIFGTVYAEVHKAFQLQSTSATAGGSSQSVTLCKQDMNDTGIYLKDAVFKLYMSVKYPGLPSDTPAFTKDGVNFYYIETKTTDDNGQILFDNQFLTYGAKAVYAVEETAAPENYLMPDDPYTFFTLGTVTVPNTFTPAVLVIADYFSVTNEKDVPANAEIKVRKDITGIDATDTKFTFNLIRVKDSNGTAWDSADGEPYSGSISITGAGENSFTIENLSKGTYYYKITEQNDAASGWEYDNAEYVAEVVVKAGTVTVTYYRNGVKIGGSLCDSSTVDVPSNEYTLDTSATYKTTTGDTTEYDNSTAWVKNNASSDKQLIMCAESDGGGFPSGQNLTTIPNETRDGYASALAYSLASESLGGLTSNEFKMFLGLPDTYDPDIITYPTGSNRDNLMHSVIWFYELNYKNPNRTYNLNNLPATNPTDWWFQALTGWGTTYSYTYLNQTINMFKEMMVQYDAGKTTLLNMTYTPINGTSGALTFSHDGFVPHDITKGNHGVNTGITDIAALNAHMSGVSDASEYYDTILTWTGTATVTVNGTAYTNGAAGVAVRKSDTITVEYTGSSPTFTLVDNAKYLKAGSIKGSRLQSGDTTKQKVIVGHAEFVTLKCTLTPGESGSIAFTNIYTTPPPPSAPRLPETGGSGMLPFKTAGIIFIGCAVGAIFYRKRKAAAMFITKFTR